MAVTPAVRRPEVLLFVFVVGFLVLLTLQVRRGAQSLLGNLALSAFGPLLSAYDSATSLTREGLQAYVWQKNAALEAERLSMENRSLVGQLELNRNLEREVLTLRGLLNAPKPANVQFVTGRALVQYGSPFSRYMLVSCAPGVYLADGTPVIGTEGAVGRVQGTSGKLHKVLLVTDPSSAVGVTSDRTGVRGVAVGKGRDMDVRWVSNEGDVKVGDLFSTSGEDDIFPAGIRVGAVTSVEDGGDYLKKITLSPSTELDQLTWVLLLKKTYG